MVTSLLFEVNLGKSFHYGNLDNILTIYKQVIFLPFKCSAAFGVLIVFRITALLRFI